MPGRPVTRGWAHRAIQAVGGVLAAAGVVALSGCANVFVDASCSGTGTTSTHTGAGGSIAGCVGCGPKRVFVTSKAFTGNLGGLAGADAICQSLAGDAGLAGAFKAWLSDSTVSAAQRLSHTGSPYLLVDGTVVANDWADLVDGTIAHAIVLTEAGGAPPATTACPDEWGVTARTTTHADGSLSDGSATCANYTTTMGPSDVGCVGVTWLESGWSVCCGGANMCDDSAVLYCIEQ
jgi:hypothetical protein